MAALAILAMVLLLAGCKAAPKQFLGPYEEIGAFYPETVDHLAAVLKERHPPLAGLQVVSDITAEAPPNGKQKFTGNLLVSFPDRARLRGSRAAIGTLFDIISVDEQLHIYFNRDGVLFSGPRSDLDESAGLLRLVGPDELMRALLAQRDLAERLQQPGRWRVSDRVSRWAIWSETPAGGWQIWVVRKSDFLVEETLVSKTGSGATARIRYWKYELIDGEPVPTQLEIHLADPAVVVEIDVDKVRLDPPLKPETFVPPSVDDDHWYPLSRLRLDPIQEN